jgi:O-antigen/teichoic acid export membrane protein
MLNLREKAIKGGAFLLIRQAVGLLISVAGVLMVTRIIGPRQYGLYAAGAGIVTFLYMIGNWGLDACLLRKAEDPEEREFHQALTLLLLIAGALCVVVIALRFHIAGFLKMPEESSLLLALALGIPLNLLTVPAVVKLDRDLNFKQVAINELVSQTGYYLVAVPMAFGGAGAWAPVAGFLTQQASLLALSYWTARFRPGLHWDGLLIKRMLSYGFGYSSSIWVYQLRNLVNPLIVGRLAGAEAVGYVAVSIRIAQTISFARGATWRLAMPAFAKLNKNVVRLRNGITEGMRFQAVAVGFPLALFALLAPFLIPLGFGGHWTSAETVFPLIALGYLTNAMFNLHSSVLYMLAKNWEVTWFHVVHVILFAGSTIVLVPRMGFVGYGWSEVIALLSYPVIHYFLARAVGSPSYRAPAIWYATSVGVIILGAIGVPALYFGFALLCSPLLFRKERSTLSGYAQVLFSRARA